MVGKEEKISVENEAEPIVLIVQSDGCYFPASRPEEYIQRGQEVSGVLSSAPRQDKH